MTVDIKQLTINDRCLYSVSIKDNGIIIMNHVLGYTDIEDLRYKFTQAWSLALGLGPKSADTHNHEPKA